MTPPEAEALDGDGTGGGSDETGFYLWVDADAAPRDVRDIVCRAAKRLELRTFLVSNQRVAVPPDNAFVEMRWVSYGPDEADQHMVDEARPGDLAVTADIPLAAALVEKGVRVIDPKGDEYTPENVRERLSIRDFMASLRDSGVETGGPSRRNDRDTRRFADALDRTLTAMTRARRR